jgi:hypothetical protein
MIYRFQESTLNSMTAADARTPRSSHNQQRKTARANLTDRFVQCIKLSSISMASATPFNFLLIFTF